MGLIFNVNCYSQYYNLDFEKADSLEKQLLTFIQRSDKSKIAIINSNDIAYKGSSILEIFSLKNKGSEGCTYYTTLPKDYCKGLKKVSITVSSRYQSEQQNGGFWVFATKGNNYLGKATTYPYKIPFPIVFDAKWQPMISPVMPYQWYTNTLEFEVSEDPDDIMIGFFVSNGNVWFDDVQISINNEIRNNFVFKL